MAAAVKKREVLPQTLPSRVKVAVYGTLKRGFGNHVLISRDKTARFDGNGVLAGYTMVSMGGFPAVAEVAGAGMIACEIWDVSCDTIPSLDALEGHPNWYTRVQVDTAYGVAWIYLMPAEKILDGRRPVVDKGVWIRS